MGGYDWYVSDVEVTLTATDNDGGSGVAKTEYSLDSGERWNFYITPFTVTTEGTTQVLARSWDNACNEEIPPVSEAVKIDRIAPTTTISSSGTMGGYDWYVSDVEVTLTATDNDGGSGAAESEYSLDAGETWQPYSSPFTITTEGINQVLARSWDIVGNIEEPPVLGEIKVDKTPPTLTETAIPAEVMRIRKDVAVAIDYSGTAEDSTSGVLYSSASTVLIDEYGELDQNLGPNLSGRTTVEAWCEGYDKDGRTYIFRFTARDYAGNEAPAAESIVTILHP